MGKRFSIIIMIFVLCCSINVNAELLDRGYGVSEYGTFKIIYDIEANLTWYDYSHPRDTWVNQKYWASELVVEYEGQLLSEWRLPKTLNTNFEFCCDGSNAWGYNVITSDLGFLFYETLSNNGYFKIDCSTYPDNSSEFGLQNKGLFEHLIKDWYWSETLAPGKQGWGFGFDSGYQYMSFNFKEWMLYGIAVMKGDVYSNLNSPPAFVKLPAQNILENNLITFRIEAIDQDADDILLYSAENLPNGSSFDTSSQIFSWVPDYNQAGNYIITFTVSDSGNPIEIDVLDVAISVGDVNRPPIVDVTTNYIVNEGETLNFNYLVDDPDGDSVFVEIGNLPTGALYGQDFFTWTPTYLEEGVYILNFVVRDDGEPVEEVLTNIVITVGNVPSPIEISSELIEDIIGADFLKELENSFLANS